MNKGKPFALLSPFSFPPENTHLLCFAKRYLLKKLFFGFAAPEQNRFDVSRPFRPSAPNEIFFIPSRGQ